MSYTVAITGKGGVGKTTVASLLVTRLIARGCAPVLAIDADPNTCLDSALGQQTVDSLIAHYERMVDHLVEKAGVDPQRVREQTLLTGSCGTGSMQMADAERVFELTAATASALRSRYG